MIRFGSVCSGIEAASVAWEPLGWKAAWFSEIEPFPSAVLAHHYPDVPNLGDMTALPDRVLSGEIEAPDVFCGGTPCQAFSVAGLRRSLDDARGNLSLTFCEIANAIDTVRHARGEQPCIVFWENVPGVLSTADNAFGCFLAGLAGEDDPLVAPGGKWTNAGCVFGPERAVAWRVLDAQYFGVAQRRRRVFVVASARDGFDPAAVLFEFDGVRRDSPPSREKGEGAAAGTGSGASVGCWWDGGQVSQTLDAVLSKGQTMPEKNRFPAVLQPAQCVTGDVTHTLKAEGFDASEDGTGRGQPIVPVGFNARQDPDHWRDRTGPLDTNGRTQAVIYAIQSGALRTNPNSGPDGVGVQADHAYTLEARAEVQAVGTAMQVRRLTPVECERLQGFPDNYTAIPWRKKPANECPDGPRYKALGNSWAVPNVRWIGARIDAALHGTTQHQEES